MWILHFLPDSLILWAINLMLITGSSAVIAGLFVHRIPVISQYQLPFRILGIALLTAGVYFRGGYAAEEAWRDRVADLQARVAQAQQQSQQANVVLDAQVIKKVKVIQDREVVVKQYIDREIVKYNSSCVIPQEFVKAHNDSAERAK